MVGGTTSRYLELSCEFCLKDTKIRQPFEQGGSNRRHCVSRRCSSFHPNEECLSALQEVAGTSKLHYMNWFACLNLTLSSDLYFTHPFYYVPH
jgi:hypothetical protein